MQENNKAETLMIGLEECAKLMNVSKGTMRKFVAMKGFPALICPHKILIDPAGLPEWIRKNYGIFKW